MCEERGIQGSTVIAFLAGGLIGAGLALLYAPQSGRETRQKIGDLASDLKDKAGTWSGDVKDKARTWSGDVTEKARTFIDREKSAIKGAYEAGREAVARERAKFEGGAPE
jgi:gas vesicle protein